MIAIPTYPTERLADRLTASGAGGLLETVVAGRKYYVELRTEEGSLERDEPYLLALAGGIKFLQAESHEEPKEPAGEETKGKPEKQSEEADKEEPKPKIIKEKKKLAKPPKKDAGLKLDLDKLDEILKEQ